MRAGAPRRYLLPPRPRLRDWPSAGAAAGLLLGLCELLVAAWTGETPSPPVALALSVSAAGVCAALAGATGLGLRLRGARSSYSALVGALVGPLLATAAVGAAWSWLGASAGPSPLQVAGLLCALPLAAVTGATTARLCDQVERGGLPVSAPALWLCVGLALAAGERLFALGPPPPEGRWAALALLPPSALAAMGAAFAVARRRGNQSRASPGRLLALSAVATVLVACAPWLAPWALYDRALPPLGDGPPNVLLAVIDAAGAPGTGALDEVLAQGGFTPDELPGSAVRSVVTLPSGELLLPVLGTRGYATAAIVADAAAAEPVGAGEVDLRRGPRHALRSTVAWTAGAPFLLGPGGRLLAPLRLDGLRRTPAQLAGEARRWLVHWRSRRAPAPFFLWLDFRVAGAPGPPPHDALAGLLTELEHLEIASRTLVLVAAVGPEGSRRAEAALRLPAGWPPPDTDPPLFIGAAELAPALLRSVGGAEDTALLGP